VSRSIFVEKEVATMIDPAIAIKTTCKSWSTFRLTRCASPHH